MLTDTDKPIDPLDDLTKSEWENLRGWEGKYPHPSLSHPRFRASRHATQWRVARGESRARTDRLDSLLTGAHNTTQSTSATSTFSAGTLHPVCDWSLWHPSR
jgi:hypothetical protein